MPFFVQELVVPESSESRYWWMSKTCGLLGMGMTINKGVLRHTQVTGTAVRVCDGRQSCC